MFEFSGKLSKECEDFLFLKQRRMEVLSLAIAFGICGLIVLVIGIICEPIILLFLPLLAFPPLIPFFPGYREAFLSHMADRIFFDLEEGTVIYENKKRSSFYMIDDIETIFDHGSFYHLKFVNVPDSYYVLDKALITKGTIEEFKACFGEKIRKVEK